MTDVQTRRAFLAANCGALLGSRQLSAAMADIRVGITVDTRPDWNGAENFLRSIVEASQVGYRWIETFWPYVERWEKSPQELKDIMLALGLRLETVSNGGGMNADFADPAKRNQVLEDHMRLVHFIRFFDCDHLKINCGRRIPGGHTGETYREMSKGFMELGKRTLDMGIKLGVHAHLFSQFETRRDIDAIMEQTDSNLVWFVHDTHQTTMAGIDPVELTKIYGSRTIEYHLKDAPAEHRGGYKGPPLKSAGGETYDTRHTYELGKGGVNFPGILFILNAMNWKGWFTVELNWTETTARHSASISKKYVEEVLGLRL